jgi:hypothetical protein
VTQRKLWRTAKPWVPHEWATMKEAWLRVLSENMRLTQREDTFSPSDLLARHGLLRRMEPNAA